MASAATAAVLCMRLGERHPARLSFHDNGYCAGKHTRIAPDETAQSGQQMTQMLVVKKEARTPLRRCDTSLSVCGKHLLLV